LQGADGGKRRRAAVVMMTMMTEGLMDSGRIEDRGRGGYNGYTHQYLTEHFNRIIARD